MTTTNNHHKDPHTNIPFPSRKKPTELNWQTQTQSLVLEHDNRRLIRVYNVRTTTFLPARKPNKPDKLNRVKTLYKKTYLGVVSRIPFIHSSSYMYLFLDDMKIWRTATEVRSFDAFRINAATGLRMKHLHQQRHSSASTMLIRPKNHFLLHHQCLVFPVAFLDSQKSRTAAAQINVDEGS